MPLFVRRLPFGSRRHGLAGGHAKRTARIDEKYLPLLDSVIEQLLDLNRMDSL